MDNSCSLIKWPGGKARETRYIEDLIPEYDRYIEPFVGGGAMFFFLRPQYAVINDISKNLTDFYRLVKEQNEIFYDYLSAYDDLLKSMLAACDQHSDVLLKVYATIKEEACASESESDLVHRLTEDIVSCLSRESLEKLVFSRDHLIRQLDHNATDKIVRTVKNEAKSPFNLCDLKENLITGYISGLYMYFRDVCNAIDLGRITTPGLEYDIANFYFIREYCYGSMFRYNAKGEFNIPYGGMSYNRKCFGAKIENIFSEETKKLFSGTTVCCKDFEDFLDGLQLTEHDFIFLDPPYDTDFSSYEGRKFTREDQKRLANTLKRTKAKFILIIKNTDYIYSLYQDSFHILCFDKTYTYNIRSRNDRKVEYLIVTNMPI